MLKRVLLGFLGVVVGLLAGMALNMGLVMLNMALHAPPEGFDWSDSEKVEAYMASLPLLGFVVVLVAHAGQAFLGALVGTLVSGRRSLWVGLIIGVLTLVGCVVNLQSIPHPTWFAVVDLLLPLPAAYLGARLVLKRDLARTFHEGPSREAGGAIREGGT